ncbi:6-bladed beta-propeller [Echinicola sp. CAU 1574]|uniref:6-bladed beta-propeller n=1 Tax=Echinicola arenosa TaxID=2774144 RepID=A0ABR9APS8_9BACT|nr:6-bladed beta-propeller [Echinicola arenosa]MBD8489873.1 6-bladed beta-propeller [Echinicola arenosa]
MSKYYFLALALLMACTKAKETIKNDVETIVINTEEIEDSVDISSVIKEIRFVPLEDKDGDYLKGADRVLITKDHYILFDRFNSDEVKVYDRLGKLVKQVGEKGPGPLEVRQINDYWLNEEGCLEIYDFNLKKIVVFDKEFIADSSFRTKDPLIFSSVTKLIGHEGYVGFKSYSPYNGPFDNEFYKLGFLDKDFSLESTALNYFPELDGALVTTPISPFERYRDSIRFYQNFDPTIYHVQSPGVLVKRFAIQYQPNPIPNNWEQQIILPNVAYFKSHDRDFGKIQSLFEGKSRFGGEWKESSRYALIRSFDEGNKGFHSLYSKSENKVIANGRAFFENERYHIALPPIQVVDEENEIFVGVWQGALLKEYILMENSPFHEKIKDEESFYLIEVTFK